MSRRERTIRDVYDGMTQEQRDVTTFLVEKALRHQRKIDQARFDKWFNEYLKASPQ